MVLARRLDVVAGEQAFDDAAELVPRTVEETVEVHHVARPGVVHAECEVIECRATSGNRGLVRTRNDIVNQHGETVITYTPLRLMAGRDG